MRPLRWLPIASSALLALVLVLCAAPDEASAQASFAEGFETFGTLGPAGPSGLVADGWIFERRSTPIANSTWLASQPFEPAEGTASLRLMDDTGLASGHPDPVASHWSILPELPALAAGDVFRLSVRTPSMTIFPTAVLEIRLAPNGGTDVGNGPRTVGDFTTLVLSIPATNGMPWTEFSAPVPAAGRLALRYLLDPSAGLANGTFDIDALTVGTPPAGPVPFPVPGQTVSWTLANSPIVIDSGLATIPAGGTVLVEEGVAVEITGGSTLRVAGDLIATGSVAAPVSVSGAGAIEVEGNLSLTATNLASEIAVTRGGSASVIDCAFSAGGEITTSSPIVAPVGVPPAFVEVAGCSFDGGGILAEDATLVVTDTTFTGGGMALTRCWFRSEAVTLADGPWQGLIVASERRPILLDGLTITDAAESGIYLLNGNARIGATTVIQGCARPITTTEGGLLAGSNVPATGNDENIVFVPGIGDRFYPTTWSDVGIPYVVEGLYVVRAGTLSLEPGAHVQFEPGATIASDPGPFRAVGTESDPVIFEPRVPGQRWLGLTLPDLLRHCEIRGAEFGAAFPSSFGSGIIESCLFGDHLLGVSGNARVRGTRFIGNDVGAEADDLDGSTNPNSFEGNGVGVATSFDATDNWWGSSSGPTAAVNPGGTGDAAAGGVPVLPFRTVAPDPTDAPPVVDLARPFVTLVPGDRLMLVWEAEDDGAIVSQRILLSPWGGAEQVVVDGLAGDVRSFEWTVPNVGPALFTDPSRIRVVAVDDSGQEGWDSADTQIPLSQPSPGFAVTTTFAGVQPAQSDLGALCWTGAPFGTSEGALIFEHDFSFRSLGGGSGSCLAAGVRVPVVSTDLARVIVTARPGGLNGFEIALSEPFEVRPDARFGDTPPVVELLTPLPGALATAGGTLPVTWSATDDRSVESISIQASYDGGETWHFVVEELPGPTSAYLWPLAEGTGFTDVQVRVIAIDDRFQATSDAIDTPFTILPTGSEPLFIRGDCNGDGAVNIADAIANLGALFSGGIVACENACEANDDGAWNIADAIAILDALFVPGNGPLPAPNVCGVDPTTGGGTCTNSPACP